jgi:hypothetical protein
VIATDGYNACEQVRLIMLDALTACARPPITTSYVAAGIVPWDDCCGTLTVGLENVFRTGVFPNPGPDPTGCFDGYIAVQLVVLVVRCLPTIDDSGDPPEAADMAAAYKALLVDAAVVWNAVLGLADPDTEVDGPQQTFVGAEGGCIAAETRFTLSVDGDRWCTGCP